MGGDISTFWIEPGGQAAVLRAGANIGRAGGGVEAQRWAATVHSAKLGS
jgi:hypothetical protein